MESGDRNKKNWRSGYDQSMDYEGDYILWEDLESIQFFKVIRKVLVGRVLVLLRSLMVVYFCWLMLILGKVL